MELPTIEGLQSPEEGLSAWNIGSVEPNGHADIRYMSGEVLVNRSKGDIDPFCPISKVPSTTPQGNLTGYGIELLTDEGAKLAGTVGPNYLLVPNQDIYQVGEGICQQSGFDYETRRLFWDGARFAAIFDLKDVRAHVVGRDDIQLSLVIQNSYNGSWAGSASLMAIDLFCQNGLLTGTQFTKPVRFKHVGDKDWQGMIGQGMGVLDTASADLQSFAARLYQLRQREVTHALADDIINGKVFQGISANNAMRILKRFYKKEEATLHGLLSASTNVLWSKKQFNVSTMNYNRQVVDGLLAYAD